MFLFRILTYSTEIILDSIGRNSQNRLSTWLIAWPKAAVVGLGRSHSCGGQAIRHKCSKELVSSSSEHMAVVAGASTPLSSLSLDLRASTLLHNME